MKRIKCVVAYDGTFFNGFQIQPKGRTVQAEIEGGLQKLHKGQEIKIFASGRTDALVHAKGQVIHFDTPLQIQMERWQNALQTVLPSDISVLDLCEVEPKFHARFDVISKEYRYYVQKGRKLDVFMRNFRCFYPYQLSVEKMRQAANQVVGTHDFTSFSSAKTDKEDKVRTIYSFDIVENSDVIEFKIVGDGFLRNMVRILVGTILEVGRGKRDPNEISQIIKSNDRETAGPTAPGQGLFLWKVNYDN
ncbi:tRNA pseudouridine(38-40) synthase TruA [Anaerobacillus alkalidiazotrophicus]|uniref:tRNA pseudouridine synthase A n=1 Tax=Anaerobacillus alkalidiazotrophicus TaxID=472963 RepID=A0A1S2MAR7_9BACI|nr:tRNA pseudouridine(38-40) synthase TruA [Anaerobacillus alkalidiazotrophicus]OIJ21650.1 tRNA pseudouridine(38-40) synthase TruA [Anaerobacillus alkalidiazotrophicus]